VVGGLVVVGAVVAGAVVTVEGDDVDDPPPSVVEVDSVDDVDPPGGLVVDEPVSWSSGCSSRPGNFVGTLKLPMSFPFVAARMNLAQISAGNEPPVTERPWTSSMGWDPSGYPIHTTAA